MYLEIQESFNISWSWQKNHNVFVITWLSPPCMSPTSKRHCIQPPSSCSGFAFIVVVLPSLWWFWGSLMGLVLILLLAQMFSKKVSHFERDLVYLANLTKYEIIMPNSRQPPHQLTTSFLAFPPLSGSSSGMRKINANIRWNNVFTMVLLLVFSSVNHREEPPLKQGDEPNTKEKKIANSLHMYRVRTK